MGPTVKLPVGCTSDDTQLRLAVGRCIRAGGRFDVEAFSKIELPVFLSYQLGAGRGTKAAARALERRSTRWFSNFYDNKGARYVDGGGNGAAMRIQPHVWAARDARPDSYLVPLLRDVICTHGHPRAILGAVLHALALGTTLAQGAIPEPDRWPGMVAYLRRVPELLRADDVLGERWVPMWEEQSKLSLETGFEHTVLELEKLLAEAVPAASHRDLSAPERDYALLAQALGGMNPRTRGSGTISAVLALWLAWAHRERPVEGLRIAAGLLGSDTDTVATMAGALLGAVAPGEPDGPVLDRDLIVADAHRMEALARGERVESFPHPDPMHWQPPASLSDALGMVDGQLAIAGLGPVEALSEPIEGQGTQAGTWQWVESWYGQRLLVKRREQVVELPDGARLRSRVTTPEEAGEPPRKRFDRRVPEMREIPEDPEGGVALLMEQGAPDDLLAQMFTHYAKRGAMAATVFATAYSIALRQQTDD